MTSGSDISTDGSSVAHNEGPPPPYVIKPPKGTPRAFVFAAPHSGRHYPDGMTRAAKLGPHTLRMSEDAYVDRLFWAAPRHGASLVVATHARAYLDLNRSELELDPEMFSPALDENTLDISHRVKAGLGLIPKLVGEGLSIYKASLPAREAFHRIDTVYKPYHGELRTLLEARQRQFGSAVLIDCHSMPSEMPSGRRRNRNIGPDIVLGDCWGASCARELTSLAEELLIRAGFSVRRNVPYSGGFATQHYGKPNAGFHALQIEISRSLYMDETTLEPLACFDEIENKMAWFTETLIREYGEQLSSRGTQGLPRAAE
ncbi:N-formylglutamate amidohydrolase [Kordiimonas aestuarii]|uniref:N-formylglutamate amidohydrolase n=1 Tax=Kordiimonas aestuarii TaxID=1005925 RepID=UPI0021D0A4B6|nr:N-formylglutamate amidohydrolase [Kordiimonas aestuarii]